jgi:hypothetical protein
MPVTIQLRASESQTAFNLKRWHELLRDTDLARLPYRIETDRHGHILRSPPPAPAHGDQQSEIVYLLKTLLPRGRVVTECPLSTSDGVKAIGCAGAASRGAFRDLLYQSVRNLCGSAISVNTSEEISEKIALYFESGAREVWICDRGTLRFRFPATPEIRPSSEMCPNFPLQLQINI